MEVCVEYIESAVNAEKAGGVRLELCSALSEGGLTPSVGLLKMVKQKVKIPVYVMIRPRTGNDFVYTEDELLIMIQDIKSLGANGADGYVFGVLNGERRIDKVACRRLLETTGGLPVTFHRAFDMADDPFRALEDLIELGVKRVLTSGQEGNALKGSKLIGELNAKSSGRISIMPGCGINENNLAEILTTTGVDEFHGTGSSPIKKELPKSTVSLGHVADESVLYIADVGRIQKMNAIFNDYMKARK